MRKLILLIIALFMWFVPNTNAQVSLSINFNFDVQPAWGPVGYDYVEYYYIPNAEVYYHVPAKRFYYFEKGRWIYAYNLPPHYDCNLYNTYKVVINEKQPWLKHKNYKTKYASYKNKRGQLVIKDSKDSKYFRNKNHPEHKNWLAKQKGNDNKKVKNNDKGNKHHLKNKH